MGKKGWFDGPEALAPLNGFSQLEEFALEQLILLNFPPQFLIFPGQLFNSVSKFIEIDWMVAPYFFLFSDALFFLGVEVQVVGAQFAAGRIALQAALVLERADSALRAAVLETYFVAGLAGVHS